MRARVTWICSVIVALACCTAASGQTAEETIAYINSKIAGKERELGNSWLRLDRAAISGTTFEFYYTVVNHVPSPIGDSQFFHLKRIDLVKTERHSPLMVDWMTRRGGRNRELDLRCGRSHGNCVVHLIRSADSNHNEEPRQEQSISFDFSPLYNEEDDQRVKKAFLHLLSLFPYKDNVELFDK